jgi:hypothetical protein
MLNVMPQIDTFNCSQRQIHVLTAQHSASKGNGRQQSQSTNALRIKNLVRRTNPRCGIVFEYHHPRLHHGRSVSTKAGHNCSIRKAKHSSHSHEGMPADRDFVCDTKDHGKMEKAEDEGSGPHKAFCILSKIDGDFHQIMSNISEDNRNRF